MRKRKPVNVKSFSIVHNAIMFFSSLYMVIETLRQVHPAIVIQNFIQPSHYVSVGTKCTHLHRKHCYLALQTPKGCH